MFHRCHRYRHRRQAEENYIPPPPLPLPPLLPLSHTVTVGIAAAQLVTFNRHNLYVMVAQTQTSVPPTALTWLAKVTVALFS